MGIDIVSCSIADKAKKHFNINKRALSTVNDTAVKGSHATLSARFDAIEKKIGLVYESANKVIIQNAINIAKAHDKLNQVTKLSKFSYRNMVFDDLRDATGLDVDKCKNYLHQTTDRIHRISSTSNDPDNPAVIETTIQDTGGNVEELLLTIGIEKEDSVIYEISRDGGATWIKIKNETPMQFTDNVHPTGNQIKVRITMWSYGNYINYISYVWK